MVGYHIGTLRVNMRECVGCPEQTLWTRDMAAENNWIRHFVYLTNDKPFQVFVFFLTSKHTWRGGGAGQWIFEKNFLLLEQFKELLEVWPLYLFCNTNVSETLFLSQSRNGLFSFEGLFSSMVKHSEKKRFPLLIIE